MVTWNGREERIMPAPGPLGWVLVAVRAGLFALITAILFLPYLVLRRMRNQRSARALAQFWKRLAMRFCGLKVRVVGTPMDTANAFVSNHCSWMDPLTLGSATPMQFVSKSEVASWPGIGLIARASGVAFIDRRRTQAAKHQNILRERLETGERLCFFPEGTSTDGLQVIPFKSTLFEVFFDQSVRDVAWVQPVTLIYKPRDGLDVDFFGWWGNTGFGAHAVQVLARAWSCEVVVAFHEPLRVSEFTDRKALARAAEVAVRAGFETHRPT